MPILSAGCSGIRMGLLREVSPGPLAPEARIMPLDQAANCQFQVTNGNAPSDTMQLTLRQATVRQAMVSCMDVGPGLSNHEPITNIYEQLNVTNRRVMALGMLSWSMATIQDHGSCLTKKKDGNKPRNFFTCSGGVQQVCLDTRHSMFRNCAAGVPGH